MKRVLLIASAVTAIAIGPAMAQHKSVKIGFVSTFSGPVAGMGNDMRNSFELALDHMGRKMGGLPVEVIYEDDGFKPDIGLQKTQKLIQSDHVDFLAGYIWSNVLLASVKPAFDSKTFLIGANAGPHQLAGEQCSPYFFSTSWQNDQTPQAMGLYMNQKGVKSVFLIGPNYAAGKDMLAGVASTFKGKILGQELTKWPTQLDFSAELAKAKAANPEAVFVFYPGKAGVQFLAQYAQAGLKGKIPLYTAFTIDELSLPLQKDLALGVPGAQEWVNDLPNRGEQEIRRRLPQEASGPVADVLRRAELRRRQPDRLGGGRHQGQPVRQGRGARGAEESRLQVGARRLQVRQQPLPDPELLSAGRGEECRRQLRA